MNNREFQVYMSEMDEAAAWQRLTMALREAGATITQEDIDRSRICGGDESPGQKVYRMIRVWGDSAQHLENEKRALLSSREK